MNNPPRLLIIDDEEMALTNLEHILKKQGYDIVTCDKALKALDLVRMGGYDVVLTDLRMEKVGGMKILEESKQSNPACEVIVITGYATVDSAIEAMKKGAYHYICKPYKIDAVRKLVEEALEKIRLRKENLQLKEDLRLLRDSGRVKIITKDPAMMRILQTARQIAQTDCNVLISGESGTGKELVAAFVHEHGKRRDKPFMAINCGVFNEELLSNELFGHEKGAYTGANSVKAGIMETAEGGTLFLDEVTEMSPSMQVKLLRVIQEKKMRRVGGTAVINVDVRFVAATNRNIQEAIKAKEFRKDLYYRLNVVALNLPPLAARKGDIPLLVQHFLEKHAKLMNRPVPVCSREVIEILKQYEFPGNVRELENIVERGIALAGDQGIRPEHLPDDIQDFQIKTFRKRDGGFPTLEDRELAYIKEVLNRTAGNKTLTAEILGIDRVSLWRKIKKYGLEYSEKH